MASNFVREKVAVEHENAVKTGTCWVDWLRICVPLMYLCSFSPACVPGCVRDSKDAKFILLVLIVP